MSISVGDPVRARRNAHRAARVTRCGWAMAIAYGSDGCRAANGHQKGMSSGIWLVVIASGGTGVSTLIMAR